MQTVSEIRKSFINYFAGKNHKIEKSSSLIPASDPTLLFTTAGMVPFKDYFSGAQRPPHNRLASIQKCLRTTDLEEVGKTRRHLSFFEMLGNFSFGDYFKKEAIEFAWEYSIDGLKFKPEDIWISIYKDDDEAYNIWNKNIKIPHNKIIRLDEKDNFWGPAGDTGACGPCSELYLDRGKEFGCQKESCAPGCDCDRFLEYWNLVFNQFFKNEKGQFEPLAATGIDTGAGLERIASLAQNVDSVYDTDELSTLIKKASGIFNTEYKGDNIVPLRVAVDHIRTLVFAMSDGIYPSNESRGYVLRRILRRALLFARRLGQKEPLFFKLAAVVNDIYGDFYPEIKKSLPLIENYIKSEEERFLRTLDEGALRLNDIIIKSNTIISGKDAFLLYDTFGFPLEMTKEMALLKNINVDEKGFHQEMENQKERGRSAWKGKSAALNISGIKETEFTGYERYKEKSKVLGIYKDNEKVQKVTEKEMLNQSVISFISEKTVFYAESGGQIGDIGVITAPKGRAEIIDTQKIGNYFIHIAGKIEGEIKEEDEIELNVDEKRRESIKKNHSATHLLNAALRKTLGEHVTQSGSLVHYDHFRFDFTHPSALKEEQIKSIEEMVNQKIHESIEVNTLVLPKEEAEKKGAVMAFGEKYGDIVRIIEMNAFSKEFCGGCHVSNTSDIQFFLILKESSPGAGNRRIEALSGKSAIKYIEEKQNSIEREIEQIKNNNTEKTEWTNESDRLSSLFTQISSAKNFNSSLSISNYRLQLKNLEKDLENLKINIKKDQKKEKNKTEVKIEESLLNDLLKTVQIKNNISIIKAGLKQMEINELKQIADQLREKNGKTLLLLASHKDNKWNMVTAATKEYAKEISIDLGSFIKEFIQSFSELKGGGGGKIEIAQASGALNENVEKSNEKINNLLNKAEESLLIKLKN
ncbi:MAG: alanine--tRNA ligase [Spirochaetia bacterium]|nr:alanine--tRNA ligase [Spirochaetia bacterium]